MRGHIRFRYKLLEIQEELVEAFLNVTLRKEDSVYALQAQVEECLLLSLPAMIIHHVVDPLDNLLVLGQLLQRLLILQALLTGHLILCLLLRSGCLHQILLAHIL